MATADTVSNMYRTKIINKTHVGHHLQIRIPDAPFANVELISGKEYIAGNEMIETIIVIKINKADIKKKSTNFEIGFFDGNQLLRKSKINFLAPH